MAATSTRPQQRPDQAARRPPQRRPAPRRRPTPAPPAQLARFLLEGVGAAMGAVAAMVGVSALAVTLIDSGSLSSLWTPSMALTALAVGGSADASANLSSGSGAAGGLASLFGGGGGMGPSVSGAVDAAPLGVTLVGTVALWFAFSWRMRQRRIDSRELALRVAGALMTAPVALMVVTALAQGSFTVSTAGMKIKGFGGGTSTGGGLGSLLGGGLMGGSGGGLPSHLALQYHMGALQVGFGAIVWASVVLAAGCLASRRLVLPAGGAWERLRVCFGPSLSALVRAVFWLAAMLMLLVAVLGLVVGGRVGTAAGAVLLLAPNLLVVLLTLGTGAAWTAAVHPAQSQGGGMLSGLMSLMGGGKQGGAGIPDRTEHLRSLSAGGWPLWLVALVVTGLVLLGCAFAAARRTGSDRVLPLHPYQGPLARHLGLAERFGLTTAVVLAALTWLAGLSGHFSLSIFGSELLGAQAALAGSVLGTAALGLLAGALAGLGGSALATRSRRAEQR